jgi:hypothetical protein
MIHGPSVSVESGSHIKRRRVYESARVLKSS